jgi:hypothetical protein
MPMHVLRDKSLQGRLAPIISVGLKLQETWYPLGTYIDPGAAWCRNKGPSWAYLTPRPLPLGEGAEGPTPDAQRDSSNMH